MALIGQMRRAGAAAMALAIGLSAVGAWALSARSLYLRGKARLEDGKSDLALMYFREVIRDYPRSRYADEAHFLVARYYHETRNYFQADRELRAHLTDYADSPYRKQVLEMLGDMEVLGLEAKALKAMEHAEYRVAKVLWQDVLARAPDHAVATCQLAECERIIERLDFQKRQLELEKQRIEAESREIAKLLKEARRQREEAEEMLSEAEHADATTRTRYETALAEANALSEELEERVEDLEADLKLWRDRAREYEARLLQEPDIGPLEGLASGAALPKIIFEGPEPDPSPERGEQQVVGIVLDASPSVVLVGEFMNEETNVLKAEVVVGLDLDKPWPKDQPHRLKVRIDFAAAADGSETAAAIPPKTVYYTLADLDEVDTRHGAYRKKLIIAVDKNTIDTYSVAAYFVRQMEP